MATAGLTATTCRRHSHLRHRRDVTSVCTMIICLLLLHTATLLQAQTEGDTGYDYNDAYEDSYDESSGMEPAFDVPIVNVTVVAGQTAVLPCSIEYLGKYKVAWLDHKSIPLTYEDRRVVDDFRFTVVRPHVKEWNLQILDIKWEDQGQYRCTINTNPVKSKIVMLHVKVPATIIDELSSDDTTVREGDIVVLVCNVTGVPRPDVTWYRRPAGADKMAERESKMCPLRSKGQGIGLVGEMVVIQNVSRYCDDVYECVASNGVPPSVSRKIRVTVEFAPEIQLPTRRIGQAVGHETILECFITAYPQAVNFWQKDGRQVTSSSKYRVDAYDEEDNTVVLSLRIHDIEHADYGAYTCVAANALGQDQETMHLYEYTGSDANRRRQKSMKAVVTYSPLRSSVTDNHHVDNSLGYDFNHAASSTGNAASAVTRSSIRVVIFVLIMTTLTFVISPMTSSSSSLSSFCV